MKHPKSNNASAPYLCHTKVGNLPDGKADIKVHHVNSVLKYWQYMERKYVRISFINVIDKATNTQIASYTTLFRPTGDKVTVDDRKRYQSFQNRFKFKGNVSARL